MAASHPRSLYPKRYQICYEISLQLAQADHTPDTPYQFCTSGFVLSFTLRRFRYSRSLLSAVWGFVSEDPLQMYSSHTLHGKCWNQWESAGEGDGYSQNRPRTTRKISCQCS